jgi:hypothetical protein
MGIIWPMLDVKPAVISGIKKGLFEIQINEPSMNGRNKNIRDKFRGIN